LKWVVSDRYIFTNKLAEPCLVDPELYRSLLSPIILQVGRLKYQLESLRREFVNCLTNFNFVIIPHGLYYSHIQNSGFRNDGNYVARSKIINLQLFKPGQKKLVPSRNFQKVGRPVPFELGPRQASKSKLSLDQDLQYGDESETKRTQPLPIIQYFPKDSNKDRVFSQNKWNGKSNTSSHLYFIDFNKKIGSGGKHQIPIYQSMNISNTISVKLTKPLTSMHGKRVINNKSKKIPIYPQSVLHRKIYTKMYLKNNLRSLGRSRSKVRSLKLKSVPSLILPASTATLIGINKQKAQNKVWGIERSNERYDQTPQTESGKIPGQGSDQNNKLEFTPRSVNKNQPDFKFTKKTAIAMNTVNIAPGLGILNNVIINRSFKHGKVNKNKIRFDKKENIQSDQDTCRDPGRIGSAPKWSILNKPTKNGSSGSGLIKSKSKYSKSGSNRYPKINLPIIFDQLPQLFFNKIINANTLSSNRFLISTKDRGSKLFVILKKEKKSAARSMFTNSKLNNVLSKNLIFIDVGNKKKVPLNFTNMFTNNEESTRNFIPIFGLNNFGGSDFSIPRSDLSGYYNNRPSATHLIEKEDAAPHLDNIQKKDRLNNYYKISRMNNKKVPVLVSYISKKNIKDNNLVPVIGSIHSEMDYRLIDIIDPNYFSGIIQFFDHIKLKNNRAQSYGYELYGNQNSKTKNSKFYFKHDNLTNAAGFDKNKKTGFQESQNISIDNQNGILLAKINSQQFQEDLQTLTKSIKKNELKFFDNLNSDSKKAEINYRIFDNEYNLTDRFKKLIFEAWQERFRFEFLMHGGKIE